MANPINIDRQTLARIFGDPQSVRAMEALFALANQAVDNSAAAITSGTIDGAIIGGTDPAAGSFTSLHADNFSITSTATVANLHAAHAVSADHATTADVATTAGAASTASTATHAVTADSATTAGTAAALSGVNDVAHGGTGLSSTPANGQLDIGNGTGFTRAGLTAGAGITITVGAGSITIAASGAAASLPRNYISGFGLANNAGTPNSKIDIAAGQAADSTNTATINGTAFTKSTAGAWAAGSGGNGMGAGLTVAVNTWYHVFAIINGGNYDAYFDTSFSAANKPTGTTAARYIGSFKTDAGFNILQFIQVGQYFYWATQFHDLSSATASIATLFTLNTPLNVSVVPILTLNPDNTSSTGVIWSPQSGSSVPLPVVASTLASTITGLSTNLSSQLYYKMLSGGITVGTTGYINPLVAQN